MTKRVLIPLVDGFEEIEAVTVIDILRRAGVTVVTAGIGKRVATGSHDITLETDSVFSDAADSDFDAIVLPGGPGTKTLMGVAGLQQMVRRLVQNGKLVAAICAAPTILAAAGILEGVPAACFPSVEPQMAGAVLVRDEVVVSGRIITSRGAGTAVPFALAVAGALVGETKAEEVARSIVYK